MSFVPTTYQCVPNCHSSITFTLTFVSVQSSKQNRMPRFLVVKEELTTMGRDTEPLSSFKHTYS
jgi:hypothetical protein